MGPAQRPWLVVIARVEGRLGRRGRRPTDSPKEQTDSTVPFTMDRMKHRFPARPAALSDEAAGTTTSTVRPATTLEGNREHS